MKAKMFLESLVPHELCQVIWNHVTICWGKHWFKSCSSPLPLCIGMVCCHPSIRTDKVILAFSKIVLKILSSNFIVSAPHISQISVPGLTHCIMRVIKVAEFRRETSNKNLPCLQDHNPQKSTVSVLFSLCCIFF